MFFTARKIQWSIAYSLCLMITACTKNTSEVGQTTRPEIADSTVIGNNHNGSRPDLFPPSSADLRDSVTGIYKGVQSTYNEMNFTTTSSLATFSISKLGVDSLEIDGINLPEGPASGIIFSFSNTINNPGAYTLQTGQVGTIDSFYTAQLVVDFTDTLYPVALTVNVVKSGPYCVTHYNAKKI